MDKLAPPLSLDNLPAVYYPGSAHAISLLDDDIISLFPHYHGPIRVRTKYVLCLKNPPWEHHTNTKPSAGETEASLQSGLLSSLTQPYQK